MRKKGRGRQGEERGREAKRRGGGEEEEEEEGGGLALSFLDRVSVTNRGGVMWRLVMAVGGSMDFRLHKLHLLWTNC